MGSPHKYPLQALPCKPSRRWATRRTANRQRPLAPRSKLPRRAHMSHVLPVACPMHPYTASPTHPSWPSPPAPADQHRYTEARHVCTSALLFPYLHALPLPHSHCCTNSCKRFHEPAAGISTDASCQRQLAAPPPAPSHLPTALRIYLHIQ